MIREVEELEHKSRRRDILVDERTLFEFYDQRIGTDVVSQKHFDTWWKKAEKQDPELLNFERSFLINDDAEQVSKLDFPNFWHQGNLKLKLTYQFEPGTDADGVTVHISAVADDGIEQSGLHIWSFAELPQCCEQKQRGFSVKAFPALWTKKMRWALNCLKQNLNKRWLCNKVCADCCCSTCRHRLNICMKNCRIKPNWGYILRRLGACWI